MEYDYSKLIGRIAERFRTQVGFAAALGMSEHSLSVKLNSKIAWKQTEIMAACRLLDIPHDEIGNYFFNLKVQSA